MQRLLSSWPCDYVNISDWIIQSSGLLQATQATVPSLGAFFWTLDNWWETHPSRFLPFSPSSMLIDHIIITFLLMVVMVGRVANQFQGGCSWLTSNQPTDPQHACQRSNELSDQKLIIIIVIFTILSNVKIVRVKISDITIFTSPILSYLWKFWLITDLAKPRSTWAKTFRNHVWLRGTWIGEIFRPCF